MRLVDVAQGEKGYLFHMREYNDSGTWKNFHFTNSDTNSCNYDGTNYALFLERTHDPVNENKIWVARNLAPGEWASATQTSVYHADDVLWDNDLTLSNPIPIGTRDYLITGMTIYNNRLWVGKEDSVWYIDFDGSYNRAYPLDVGLDAISSPNNCKAMAAQDLYLYFNFSHSVERMYGGTLDDVGPWRGAGLIERASGDIVHLEPSLGWIFGALDGGSQKQSALMAYQFGWHNLFRAPSIQMGEFKPQSDNPRIRSVHWQSISGQDALHRLWFEMGGYLMFMEMPSASLNPAQDSNMYLAPESYVVQSHMDAGYAELEKHFEKARHVSYKDGGQLYLDWDADPNPFSFSWTNATQTDSAPSYEYDISESGTSSRKRGIMLRTRISTNTISDSTSNNVLAIIADTFARTPVKMQWTFPVRLQRGGETLDDMPDHDPETLYNALFLLSTRAEECTLKSVVPWMDNDPNTSTNYTVVVEPMPMKYDFWDEKNNWVDGTVIIKIAQT
ncbi:MAG: hypothetical protein ACYTBX_19260 [Planctomycetota bacterium]